MEDRLTDRSMLERAARAARAEVVRQLGGKIFEDGMGRCEPGGKKLLMGPVIAAALRALRVPDEAMLEAMGYQLQGVSDMAVHLAWSAGIDSILADPSCEAQRAKQEQPAEEGR